MPPQPNLLQSLFKLISGGTAASTNVLLLIHKVGTRHRVCCFCRPPSAPAKVIEEKEKGGVEERLCPDCSGIWGWFNEENDSWFLNCCGFLFDWMLVFFQAFKGTNAITLWVWEGIFLVLLHVIYLIHLCSLSSKVIVWLFLILRALLC